MHFLALLSLGALAAASPIVVKPIVVKRQYTLDDTENQLTDGTPCRDLTILFARGTLEGGNVGEVAGPPFFQAVANMTGAAAVAVQGVSSAFPTSQHMNEEGELG